MARWLGERGVQDRAIGLDPSSWRTAEDHNILWSDFDQPWVAPDSSSLYQDQGQTSGPEGGHG